MNFLKIKIFFLITLFVACSESNNSQDNDDQKRSGSIYNAIQFGTDFVVVGREITQAKNPEGVLKKIESLIV